MKALFLAGGMGTRLRPLTDRLPKPMVPIMGKPLLERNFDRLKAYGIKEFVLSTCYKPERIEEYFGSGGDSDMHIDYVTEDLPLGTGGAIKNCENFFRDTFLIFNADILSDINFKEMISFHKRKKADVTIAVKRVEDPTAYGVIEYDDNDYAITFKEKPKPHEVVSHYINAGIYLFEPDVLKKIATGRAVSVEREIFPKLLEKGKKIAVYKGCDYWLDIGTPEKYAQAHQDTFCGRYKIEEADFAEQSVYGRFNAKINSTAVIKGPIYLGEDVLVEAGAVIGPNVVIGDNCRIGKKCKVADSIIWNNVDVKNGVKMVGSIVTSDCVLAAGSKYEDVIYTGEQEKHLAIS